MTSGPSFFTWLRATALRRKLIFPAMYVALGVLIATPLRATVNSGEIIPGSVSATISSTYDPVNGYSVTFQWTTVHPGNSIVVIENDLNYEQTNNSPSRQIDQSDHTTNHVVLVDHFPAYSEYSTWGYYVASNVGLTHCPTAKQAVCTEWATFPGPATSACGTAPFPGCGGYYLTLAFPTSPTNPNGTLAFTMWPVGGINVYQGDPTQLPACTPTSKSSRECNDLYVATQANLMSGSPDALVIMENPVITNLDTGQIVTDNSITAQYLCDLGAPSNPPPQGWDGDYNPSNEGCYHAALYSSNTMVRLRANSHAVPGHYQFTGSFQGQLNGSNAGNPVAITYNFNVLPTASFTATPPSNFPTIPGLSTWQSNMVNWNAPAGSANADFWCTNNTDTNPWFSLDNGNFSGYFDIPYENYFQAWNYDGGRIYQQVLDYDYWVLGDQNQNHLAEWPRCAELAMEPYKDETIGTVGGFVQEPNQFPFGMAMAYMRNGDSTYQNAVNQLATAPAYDIFYSGSVYLESDRVSAYIMDDRLAAEIIGAPRNTAFLLRGVDVMLGYLDQSYNLSLSNPNQQEAGGHPFMVGLAMEALITYYELDLAEGNTPDARIPLEIKKYLDWLEATQYVASTHTLAYGAYDVPPNNPRLVGGILYGATELNDLVATAFAWYWSKTGNNTYLNQGDDLFQHVFDSAGGQNGGGGAGWTWAVKEYNQVYKWSFDYVRWRSGQNPDGSSPAIETVLAGANPYSGAWTDYTTPVQFIWNPGIGQLPSIYPTLQDSPTLVTVTGTTATILFNVFKPDTTLTVYYGQSAPGTCNLNDPQPPYCMQPFPNFGFLQMLNASYLNQSQTTTVVQDPVALSEGINNIYDATVTITGLTPNTTYHWRPLTTDPLGNMAAYYDQTFTTSTQ
jgi:hypothetical protein